MHGETNYLTKDDNMRMINIIKKYLKKRELKRKLKIRSEVSKNDSNFNKVVKK